jgi:SEC-C motif domain protein
MHKNKLCPCSQTPYLHCCAPFHEGAPAPTAEALMRSRYSAYALGLEAYLLATWHPDTRPVTLDLSSDAAKWIDLKVLRAQTLGPTEARVEFIARCRIGGRAQRLHETSQFQKIDERWYYVDGLIADK